MEEFNTSLIREKITLTESLEAAPEKDQIVIRSNRLFLNLKGSSGSERIVIRTQNMHTTLRLAALLLVVRYREGSFLDRTEPFDWADTWASCLSEYEKEYNAAVWAIVYINGKTVFKTMSSIFVDIIETCAILTQGNYDATMDVTKTVLKRAGKDMDINHSSIVAGTFSDDGDLFRGGIIHRTDIGDIIFNFTVQEGEKAGRIVQAMMAAAAYLEFFSLNFILRNLNDKIRSGKVEKTFTETNQIRAAIGRQNGIRKAISSFEENNKVTYNPAKPALVSEG